jgi:hypothetical protein
MFFEGMGGLAPRCWGVGAARRPRVGSDWCRKLALHYLGGNGSARCKHALRCDVSIGGAGDLLSIVGGIMTPKEFCFLAASHVEKVAGALMLLSVGMFGPQDRTNKKRK